MTARRLVAAWLCLGALAPGAALAAAHEMSFFEALEAAADTPQVARLATEVATAEASLVGASTYPYNPTLEIEAADRRGARGSTTDRAGGISQELELAGQRGKRRAVAEASLSAARASYAQARRAVLVEAALAFVRAVHDRQRLETERTEAQLARSFADLVERRLEVGTATALDLALAQAGLARAEQSAALAEGTYRTSQARLAQVVGIAGATRVEPVGELPPLPSAPDLEETLSRAMAVRGDLEAARSRVEAAEARLRLARADRLPNLTLGLRAGREEGDDIAGFGLSLPLPLFERNQGGIAAAEAELAATRADLALQELAVRREVATAHTRLTASLEARRLARRLGMTPLEEGLELLERSFEAGKVGAAELLVYRRELVAGRRQVIEAEAEAWESSMELAVAAGTPLPGLEWMERQEPNP